MHFQVDSNWTNYKVRTDCWTALSGPPWRNPTTDNTGIFPVIQDDKCWYRNLSGVGEKLFRIKKSGR